MGNILSSLKIALKSLLMPYFGQPVLPDMSIVWWETLVKTQCYKKCQL